MRTGGDRCSRRQEALIQGYGRPLPLVAQYCSSVPSPRGRFTVCHSLPADDLIQHRPPVGPAAVVCQPVPLRAVAFFIFSPQKLYIYFSI